MTYIPADENLKMLTQFDVANQNNAYTVYTSTNANCTKIVSFSITNTGNQDVDCIMYQDNVGSTYNDDTTIMLKSVSRNTSELIEFPIHLAENGTIGFEADRNNSITLTIWGVEL